MDMYLGMARGHWTTCYGILIADIVWGEQGKELAASGFLRWTLAIGICWLSLPPNVFQPLFCFACLCLGIGQWTLRGNCLENFHTALGHWKWHWTAHVVCLCCMATIVATCSVYLRTHAWPHSIWLWSSSQHCEGGEGKCGSALWPVDERPHIGNVVA